MKRLAALFLAVTAFGAHATITICEATTQGPLCHVTEIDRPPAGPRMCTDQYLRPIPCANVGTPQPTMCRMTVDWPLADPDHPMIIELTPVCADEADVAASQTTTKILKLGR